MVLLPLSPHKDFKYFWRHGLEQELGHCFADLPSTGKVCGPDAAAPAAL